MAESNTTEESRGGEPPHRGYVLGIYTPIMWDEGAGSSMGFGGLVEQRVVLTNVHIGSQDLEKQIRNDACQAECACDCACM